MGRTGLSRKSSGREFHELPRSIGLSAGYDEAFLFRPLFETASIFSRSGLPFTTLSRHAGRSAAQMLGCAGFWGQAKVCVGITDRYSDNQKRSIELRRTGQWNFGPPTACANCKTESEPKHSLAHGLSCAGAVGLTGSFAVKVKSAVKYPRVMVSTSRAPTSRGGLGDGISNQRQHTPIASPRVRPSRVVSIFEKAKHLEANRLTDIYSYSAW